MANLERGSLQVESSCFYSIPPVKVEAAAMALAKAMRRTAVEQSHFKVHPRRCERCAGKREEM